MKAQVEFEYSDTGPMRDSWAAVFHVKEVADAALERQQNHSDHEAYWALKYDTWNAEMREKAVVETVPITGGEQQVLRYDQGLQNKVNDAKTRRNSHAMLADQYRRWGLLLDQMQTETLALRFDDVSFFFGPMESLPEEREA